MTVRLDPRRLDCSCGHSITDHSRGSQDGNYVWRGCKRLDCTCSKFTCRDGTRWPSAPAAGAV